MKQLLGGMAQDLQRPQPHASNGNGNGNGKHGPVKFVPVILTGDFNATPISPCCSVRIHWDYSVLFCTGRAEEQGEAFCGNLSGVYNDAAVVQDGTGHTHVQPA